MTVPKPTDPLHAKLAKLERAVRTSMRDTKVDVYGGQRVELSSAFDETPHGGTVSEVEDERFKISWDSVTRRSGEPRQRYWYSRRNVPSCLRFTS